MDSQDSNFILEPVLIACNTISMIIFSYENGSYIKILLGNCGIVFTILNFLFKSENAAEAPPFTHRL
jgi:hypothetical protein